MDGWDYERDASTVMARRNEAYRALHVALMPHRFVFDRDALEHFLEHVLVRGPIREELDSLPLDLGLVQEQLADLQIAVERAVADESEIAVTILNDALERCAGALESACAETGLAPDSWRGGRIG